MILTKSLCIPPSELEVEKPSGVAEHRALFREQFSGSLSGSQVLTTLVH